MAFRLGMIVFRKTVCSSSTNGTKHVIVASDDEDALARVTVGVRVVQDVEQVATLNMEDDVLGPTGRHCVGPIVSNFDPITIHRHRQRRHQRVRVIRRGVW